jgi:hypothetical protein
VSPGVRTMCRSCAEAFVRPGTCVVQRRKLRRSMARRHRSSQWGEHACSGSVARRHGESGRSCGCISKEDGSKDFIEVYPKLLHIPLSNQPCFVSLCSYILALFHRTCPTRRVLVHSIVLSVTGIEPTVDRQKSRWSIPARADGRSQQGKIGGTVVTSLLMRVPMREALALGLLMNTKGLVELIVLNIGHDRKVLNVEVFAILVLMALITTFMTVRDKIG